MPIQYATLRNYNKGESWRSRNKTNKSKKTKWRQNCIRSKKDKEDKLVYSEKKEDKKTENEREKTDQYRTVTGELSGEFVWAIRNKLARHAHKLRQHKDEREHTYWENK